MPHSMLCTSALVASALAVGAFGASERPQSAAVQQIDLANLLASGKLRAVNRTVAPLQGDRRGIHVDAKEGPGLVWIEGSDVGEGTIDAEIRGKDVQQQSFVGIAFHRKDDKTYEAVYLRPFNFRATEPDRHQHAVQYISVPEYDWPRLRKEFPEEFENPVDASLVPADWVHLRIVVSGKTVQVYAGKVQSPTLEVRKLGTLDRGAIGLWVGNNSDGDFADVRITPVK
jgi:hypothetical protein